MVVVGIYVVKYSTGVVVRYIEVRFGKFLLVREISRLTVGEVIKYSIKVLWRDQKVCIVVYCEFIYKGNIGKVGKLV